MSDAKRRRPISLLLVSHSYPPVLGGSEIEAQRVCAALLRRGHQVTVLCAGGAPMPDQPRWTDPLGVPVRIFGGSWPAALRDYAYACGVAWTLLRERKRYQLVYFLMQGVHLAAGLPVAHLLGKPIVMKISGSSIITLMRNSWLGRLELRWLRQWSHRVMILNSGMEQEAVAAGFQSHHLLWMPNPVDTAEFTPCDPARRPELRAALGIPGAAPVVIYVGRLAPEKELPSLLGAFAEVMKRLPDATLVLVGDGPVRNDLADLAARLGIAGKMRFTGRQTLDQVRQWLQASDAFTLLSSNEGFPCSLLEAMSAGLPSVVSDIPANLQLIDHNVQGLVAALRDEAAIADALVCLLSDSAARAELGAAARRRVLDHYSTGKVMDRYEALFAGALAGKGA
jgi:glycosyltransferase involved in cell wall biosynthesis